MTNTNHSTIRRMQNALDRSLALRLADQVDGSATRFIVPSTSRRGVYHHVRCTRGQMVCDCEAGRQHEPCVHAAACFRVKHNLHTVKITLRGTLEPENATSRTQEPASAPGPAARTPVPAASHSPAGRGRLATDEPTSLAALLGRR